ncbi:hypothetical protein, partial [Salegentibacter salarius]|uniref:hypothetical protein n=1 Tax=Salegentibacter salarius TaxID=435906 RepID=UPI001C4049DF
NYFHFLNYYPDKNKLNLLEIDFLKTTLEKSLKQKSLFPNTRKKASHWLAKIFTTQDLEWLTTHPDKFGTNNTT